MERSWNVANNNLYIQSLKENKISFEKETLTATQKLNEYIMISLRTMEGCDLDYIETHSNKKAKEEILRTAQEYIHAEKLELKNQRLILTREGKLLADGISADLFFENL